MAAGGRRGRRAVRVAARRRPGDGGLRGRDRDARAAEGAAARRGRASARARPTSSRTFAARRLPSLEPAPDGRRSAERCALARRAAWRRVSLGGICARRAGAAEDRARQHRLGADQLEPDVRAARAGDDVQRDGAARASPGTRSSRRRCRESRVRLSDAMQGTFIGVLMSSTLPARLGEPSRALVVARRTGRPRENLPVVLGTLVSQTLLNIVALAILGRDHVLVGRPLQRPPERAAGRRDRPGGAARCCRAARRRSCCAAGASRRGSRACTAPRRRSAAR